MVVRVDTVRYLGVTAEECLDGTLWIGPVDSSACLDFLANRRLQAGLEREKHLTVILCSLCNE